MKSVLLLVVLVACCPAPLRQQAVAFRAAVVGVSPGVSALHLKSHDMPLLTLTVKDGVVRSSTGQYIPLPSLNAGDNVYVQGTLSGGDLNATEVRRLD